MTKIYLVKGTYMTEDYKILDVNLNVFTNKRLAKIYCKYKNLKKEKCDKSFIETKYTIEEHVICKLDWSKEINALEIERLPY